MPSECRYVSTDLYKSRKMFYIKILMFLLSALCDAKAQNVTKVFGFGGDVSVAVIFNGCGNSSEDLNYSQRTIASSAIWVTERINFLEILFPLKLGISVYKTCSELDLLKTIFDIYENDVPYTLGLVTTKESSEKVKTFSNVLGIKTKRKRKYHSYLIRAAVQFLNILGWRSNVTLVTTDEHIVDVFYLHSKKVRVCISDCYIFEGTRSLALNATAEDPLVLFGTASAISQFFINDTYSEDKFAGSNILVVPLDGDVPIGLPEGSFVILAPHTSARTFKRNTNILPTPLLFEIADPLISFAVETRTFISTNCNDTANKISCLRNRPSNLLHLFPFIAPSDILSSLKITPLEQHFGYDIYKVESTKNNDTSIINSNIYLKPFKKIFTYNMFYDNLTLFDETFEIPFFNESSFSGEICLHEFIIHRDNKIVYRNSLIYFRSESWIYAFISLSLLGVLFCVAILIFLLVAIFQRRILEGNPVMTLLLLFAVMLLFCSVLPFGIENTKSVHRALCITKALAVTLSYAAIFSLLLSRCIVLGSAAKEVGFMSHIAGPVQSFLCLFVFGVQAALSLHVMGRCNNIFTHGYDFVYLMSYNSMLLILLICLTPLIYKSQRNYREGKYFTIAIILIALVWCVWLPCFIILCSEWKEMMVCLGLVSTGSICLGAIFIPRTYLMTIAAERDKITSALPSLNTATSAIDLYRAHTQPIYDCVNIAAINAAAVARAGVAPTAPTIGLQQPDLYSCPALPEDIDFDLCCDSPTNTDKVTRF